MKIGQSLKLLHFNKLHFNKKAQAASINEQDLFLILLLSIVFIFFVGILLFIASKGSLKGATENFESFKQIESALLNLRMEMQAGENLEGVDLNEKIKNSKVLGGKVIASCHDYIDSNDCLTDTVKIAGNRCVWLEEQKGCVEKVLR